MERVRWKAAEDYYAQANWVPGFFLMVWGLVLIAKQVAAWSKRLRPRPRYLALPAPHEAERLPLDHFATTPQADAEPPQAPHDQR